MSRNGLKGLLAGWLAVACAAASGLSFECVKDCSEVSHEHGDGLPQNE